MCVCVYNVCVCVWEREREKKGEQRTDIYVYLPVWMQVLFFQKLIWNEKHMSMHIYIYIESQLSVKCLRSFMSECISLEDTFRIFFYFPTGGILGDEEYDIGNWDYPNKFNYKYEFRKVYLINSSNFCQNKSKYVFI